MTWKRFILKTAVLTAFLVVAATCIFGFARVDGDYMKPAVKNGDIVILFRREAPRVRDVVAYKDAEGQTRLGRVVAIGGENVDIDDAGFSVNGIRPAEQVFWPTAHPENGIELPYRVPEGAYFLLNDFREDTDDSRAFGAVDASGLIGKVVYVFRAGSI